MTIGFFHNRLDWINEALIQELKKHAEITVYDVNTYGLYISDRTKFPHTLYVNRVYPSEAASSYGNMRFMLEVTRHIENLGIPIVNPFSATYADYSKTEANNLLESKHIPTAQAALFPNKTAALLAGEHMQFPKIVKMDCGGKARNVAKVNNYREYKAFVEELDHDHHLIHVEDMLESVGYTTRLVVLDYAVVSITRRSLVDGWLGNSTVSGSEVVPYPDPPQSLYELGTAAAKALSARIVTFDVVETRSGARIVDVNTTPVFNPASHETLSFAPEEEIAKVILTANQ